MPRLPVILTAIWLLLITEGSAAACPPDGYSRQDLLDLKQAGFEIAAPDRDPLAIALLDCLADPDPAIRDGVVYEGLTTWLRGNALEPATIDGLYVRLLADLAVQDDVDGFLQPFAALVLSEVARTDRIGDTFTLDQRMALVDAATAYMTGIDDYRGFSETEGWRHGVAHGSDLVLQLVLNEHIDASQVDRLVTATLSQVAPREIFYVYGEPNRLARAVYYAYTRGVADDGRWQHWLRRIAAPAPLSSWNDAYSSQAGLARRHDTLGFLMALHVYAGTSATDGNQVLDAMVTQAIEQVW